MMAATLATRRREYLDSVADAALHEQDEAAARRKEAAEAERVAKRRHQELSRRRDSLVEERLGALTEAERNCRAMIKAMGRVLQFGAEAGAVYGTLGERSPPGLSGPSAERALGDRLSVALGTLTKSAGRFGGVTLARSWRKSSQSWTEESIAPVRRTETRNTDNV